LAVLFPVVLGWPVVAFGVLVVSGLTDVLDGWYARTRGQATPTGAVIDAITDKVFVAVVVVSLVVSHHMTILESLLLGTREVGELPLVLRLAFSPTARRARTDRTANVPGKLATALQFVAVTAVLFGMPRYEALLWLAAGGGAVAAVTYWLRERAGA
jgi:CDP-diacylglycerol--glycerol-3-phosphate 3-phosphatidyltransferase/cardiolipin synthase